MDQPNHHDAPEIWFRPSPAMSFNALLKLFDSERGYTPRLGRRNRNHWKGYISDTVAMARLFDERGDERRCKKVRIVSIVIKLFHELSESDVRNVGYGSKESLLKDLSLFEGRQIAADEAISIIEFTFVN